MSRSRLLEIVIGLSVRCSLNVSAAELCVTSSPRGEDQLSLCSHDVFRSTNAHISEQRLIAVPGSPILIALWNEDTEAGTTPFYAISRDGHTFLDVRATDYRLRLQFADFDPLVDAINIDPALASDQRNEMYIVQFVTHPLQEYRDLLSMVGAPIRGFIPHHAYLLQLDDATRMAVQDLAFVRALTPYHPAFRLEPFLRNGFLTSALSFQTERVNILVSENALLIKQAVADAIASVGGAVNTPTPGSTLLNATLNPVQLLLVAHLNEVIYIDRVGEPVELLDVVREFSGANYAPSLPLAPTCTAREVRGEVMEPFVANEFHEAFQTCPPITHAAPGVFLQSEGSHATSTYGIIFAAGEGFPSGHPGAKGIIPEGQGIVAGSDQMRVDRTCHTCELVSPDCYGLEGPCGDVAASPGAPFDALFQSNSWGNVGSLGYTCAGADLDSTLLRYELAIFQGQGNCGGGTCPHCGNPNNPKCSVQQAWSKNVISVGGIQHRDSEASIDDSWVGVEPHSGAPFMASKGLSSDGRVKPDLSHFFDSILTTGYDRFDGSDGNENDDYTLLFGGTSAATPIVAGLSGIFFQMWGDGVFGNAVDPQASVFVNRPSSPTTKAVLVNSARQYCFGGEHGVLPPGRS